MPARRYVSIRCDVPISAPALLLFRRFSSLVIFFPLLTFLKWQQQTEVSQFQIDKPGDMMIRLWLQGKGLQNLCAMAWSNIVRLKNFAKLVKVCPVYKSVIVKCASEYTQGEQFLFFKQSTSMCKSNVQCAPLTKSKDYWHAYRALVHKASNNSI